jgi:hypothetical protein
VARRALFGLFLHAAAPPSSSAAQEKDASCPHPQGSIKTTMADDPNKRGPQDRTRINVNEPHEVRYWTQTLGVTEAQLRSAVAAAGVEVKDVRVYLGKP